MRRFELKQEWWYDRPACDCCEGFYDEAWVVYENGENISSHYSQEAAKAWILDLLIETGEVEYSEELSDYPG